MELKVLRMKTKCVWKFFIPVSENSVLQTIYIHKQTVKTIVSYDTSH